MTAEFIIVDKAAGPGVDHSGDPVVQAQVWIDAEQASLIPVPVEINQPGAEIFSAKIVFHSARRRLDRTYGGDASGAHTHVSNVIETLRRINDARVPEDDIVAHQIYLCLQCSRRKSIPHTRWRQTRSRDPAAMRSRARRRSYRTPDRSQLRARSPAS